NAGSDTLSVLLNNGNGTFAAPVSLSTGSNGHAPAYVVLADVNGDGQLDLITANAASDTVSVFLANGNGTFGTGNTFAVGSQDPKALAVGDINGDARKDLVVADAKSNQVSVLLGNGNGTFGSPQLLSVGQSPLSVALADLDGIHGLDIVAANAVDDTV